MSLIQTRSKHSIKKKNIYPPLIKGNLTYAWDIEVISPFRSTYFNSPHFHAIGLNTTVWRMSAQTFNDSLCLYLILMESEILPLEATYQFSILNYNGDAVNIRKIDKPQYFRHRVCYGFQDFIEIQDILNPEKCLLFEGTLTIMCTVQFMAYDVNIQQPALGELSENLENIVCSDKFSDAVLVVGDEEFPVHKAILSVRSKVFAAMFAHDMEESKQNRVIITDIGHEVVKEMLHFIYTAKAPNLKKMAGALLAAADKYALEKLKKMCEKALYESLSIESAAEILILAELHSSYELKKKTLRYIRVNATEISMTQNWLDTVQTYSYIFLNTFPSLLKRLHFSCNCLK